MNITTSSPIKTDAQALTDRTRRISLTVVTALFFMWGFLTCLNDILIPKLKAVFELNYLQSSFIQFTFFGAYFIMSIPAGKIVSRYGYQAGMVLGLLTAALGALLFYPAASCLSYGLFLGALFVLACGITLLQVAANPYISALGKPETASSRLNLAQGFNSLGTTLAPFFGGWLILSAVSHTGVTDKLTQAASVRTPYLGLATALAILAIIIGLFKLPRLTNVEEKPAEGSSLRSALKIKHLCLGMGAIFLYVGAEVSIGSYLINFMADRNVARLATDVAARFVAYYWGGAMIGRFLGSALLQRVRSNRLLVCNAIIAVLLLLIALFTSGHLAMWSVLAIGFFNSVMFPNIFTLSIDRLGHLTSEGSSLLVMSIVGGAIVPVVMGQAADTFGIHHSLFIPALCYLYIAYYGLSGYKVKAC